MVMFIVTNSLGHSQRGILANMKIGIFDSGIGGEAIAGSLRLAFPESEIITVSDRENMPYGSKSPDLICQLVDSAVRPLLDQKCDVIVIACNTATTLALPQLRERYPQQQFIGIEPMIKTASVYTRSGIVCVCATPATLASTRYNELKKMFGGDNTFIEPDCRDWAQMIEDNAVNEKVISDTLTNALNQGADVIVLGCTHYHWIKELVETIADGRAVVLEPSESIAKRVKQLVG